MLRQASIYFLFRAGNGVVALLSVMLLTRWLPAEQYGRYALGISGANVIAAIGFQWLNVSVGRFHGARELSHVRLYDSARCCAIFIATVTLSGALLWVSLDAPSPGSAGFVLTVAALGVTLGVHGLHLQWLNARQDALRYGWLTASRAWLSLGLSLLAVWSGGLSTAALAGTLAGSAAAVMLIGARRPGEPAPDEQDRPRTPLTPELLRFGLPLSLTYLSVAILDAGDRFMLYHWHGPSTVAVYGATFDLVQQILGAALNVLYLASYPKVIAAWESEGANAAKAAMASLWKAALPVASLGALMFAGLAPDITTLMLGHQISAEAGAVMPLVAMAVTFSGLRAFCFDIALHLRRATRLHVTTTALMAAVNLALNVALIPCFGAWGAAVASAVAFGLGAVLSLWFGRTDGLFENIGLDIARACLSMLAGWLCMQAAHTHLLHLFPEGGASQALIHLLLCGLAGMAGWLGIQVFLLRQIRQ